ncbi:MAG TPA: branched-chain amino acid ABC transporter permease [Xanthobacteraceae bacterium]|nr:branched-chain amino acid ABC transporter permease [Xanthobacteraceae bacterium]
MQGYILNLLILVSISGILAASLNFIIGYAGIYSMAHAAFFGVAAYAGALIALHLSPSLLVAIPVAMALCAALSLVISLPSLRVRGEYFVVASLGLQMIAFTVFSEWKDVTGGIGGLTGVPIATLFGFQLRTLESMFAVSLSCLALTAFVIYALVHTSFGRSLKAIRDNEVAAASFGKNPIVIKTIAVAISTAFCGVAGVLYAFHISFVNPESFTVDQSVFIMSMIIIGGTGTVLGPILGALIIHLLPAGLTYLTFLPARDLASLQQIIYGAAMVLLMIYRPSGLIGRANVKDTWSR